MLKKRKAQGLSITTIIIAVIGLIVIVVLIGLFTGRIGSLNVGLDESIADAKTCNSRCTALGLNFKTVVPPFCGDQTGEKMLSGTFTDVTGKANYDDPDDDPDVGAVSLKKVCCCY